MRSERSNYTPVDFGEWKETGKLVLSPKFQRRGVWTTPARSYLIDTLLLGMPVPPIYLRVVQNSARQNTIREVVDGQQRVAAVLDFMADKYALAKNIESPFVGKRYSELPQEEQNKINRYSFICEVFYGLEDREVLQIFARLNLHSVKLNAQELRNGKWFGFFKRSAYQLATEHLEFWRQHRIFTELAIARMSEVELASDLMILEIDGLQDKKTVIDSFYERFDEEFSQRRLVESRFRTVIDVVNEACGDFLADAEFRRPPLFYSLFGAVYHHMWGVPNEKIASAAKGRITSEESERLASAVRKLSGYVSDAKTEEPVPASYHSFVTACLRQTDNIKPRRTRLITIYNEAFAGL